MASIDFLMIYPHGDHLACSQRVLLGVLEDAGYSTHLSIIASTEGIENDPAIRQRFLDMVNDARLVGFGFMSPGYPTASYLTKLIHDETDKLVLWGGPHPTDNFRELVGEPDAMFVGESEISLQQFVKAYFAGEPYDKIPGVIVDKLPFIPATKDTYIQDLDDLPDPFYRPDGHSMFYADRVEDTAAFFKRAITSITLLTSRGCPYKCTYCSNDHILDILPEGTKVFRKRSVDHVIREIKHFTQFYDIDVIIIDDDLFLARGRKDLEEFVGKYSREVNIPVVIEGITPSFVTLDAVSMLRNLPLSALRMGIESANEAGMKLFKRDLPNKNMDRAVENLKLLSKRVLLQFDFIVDSPWESESDYVETLRFMTTLPRPYDPLLYHLSFYEGTSLRLRAIKEGFITADDRTHETRPYGLVDDSFVNSFFKLLKATQGLVPAFYVFMLTSDFVMRRERLKNVIRMWNNGVAAVFSYLPIAKYYRRFHLFCYGKYNLDWMRRHIVRRLAPQAT